MFKDSTTFVVGAGASKEIGLPLGSELKQQIIELLAFDPSAADLFIDDRFNQVIEDDIARSQFPSETRQSWRDAAVQIKRGLPRALSIDNYLHTHEGDEYVERLGKLAISFLILRAERFSAFFEQETAADRISGRRVRVSPSIDNTSFASSWHEPFAQLVMSGAHVANPESAFEDLRFIIFNYDRCVEQYLYLALQDYFNIDGDRAALVLSQVQFIHPYGSLGPLPWQALNGRRKGVRFGAQGPIDYWELSQEVHTFTEAVESDTDRSIKVAVAQASTIVFLGFGFNEQNVRLLTPHGSKNAKSAFTTAKGISLLSHETLRRTLVSFMDHRNPNVWIENEGCRDLFTTFQLPLSQK
ncbi:hypothetical protein QE361_001933 [Sphingomonas sp. SORGH_AS802]|uniref:hypothetical protein n=1 Tax=unclassified Sphingomonas TaxID=196159 RepID=UPI0028567713|nr:MULTISPECIES: hypothetical protein [unclassified Sphingomonas]MDR6126684.1 hypothetical protein [Sphingomonas sp. SORGH_AS_0438]MDR6134950.1 hypothetical protein [Sphingomonas sp. SORGH_AS_0802]